MFVKRSLSVLASSLRTTRVCFYNVPVVMYSSFAGKGAAEAKSTKFRPSTKMKDYDPEEPNHRATEARVGVEKEWHDMIREPQESVDEGTMQQNPSESSMIGSSIDLDNAGDMKLPEDQIEELRKRALAGDVEGLEMLGVMHWHGYGVPKDLTVAEKYLTNASRKGSQYAMLQLAHFYLSRDMKQAESFAMLKKLEEISDDPEIVGSALETIGNCYDRGQGVAEDQVLAWKYYENAATKGATHASMMLAAKLLHLIDNRGSYADVTYSTENANPDNRKHSESGFYINSRCTISPESQEDADKGLAFLNNAAETGYIPAQCFLMHIYSPFNPSIQFVTHDMGKYLSFANLAAQFGEFNALVVWGRVLFYGLHGQKADQTEGVKLLKQAKAIFDARGSNKHEQSDEEGEEQYFEHDTVTDLKQFFMDNPGLQKSNSM